MIYYSIATVKEVHKNWVGRLQKVPQELDYWRHRDKLMKQGLPSHKIGRKRVFLIDDLIRWIKEH